MDDRVALGASFGEEHFGAAQLGDHRRTKRLVQLADKMVMHPGGTLPDKIDDPASLKALYRLVNREEVTHATVLAPSRERTLRLMREVEGTVLVIQDTTELDFSGLASLEGLGAIGNGGCRGYLAHNALAVVAETRNVIGLVYQKLAKRPKVNREGNAGTESPTHGSVVAVVEGRQRGHSGGGFRSASGGSGRPGRRCAGVSGFRGVAGQVVRGAVAIQSSN